MQDAPPAETLVPEAQRYRLLIDAVTDYAIYMLDTTGRVISWNPGAKRFKGYEAAEIIGHHFSRFYSDEDREAGLPRRALETAVREGRFESTGWRIRKDGTRFWAFVIIDPIRDAATGGLLGFAKITRDLTERKLAEQSLRDSEDQFRRLVQGVTDYAIYMLDPQGYVANWNSGAQRIKGYTPQEIIGEHFSRFYTEDDRSAGQPAQSLATAAREGKCEMEGWRVRKDGTRFWAHVVIDPIRDETGELIGFAKITRDITERAQAQTELEQARQSLVQAQKMEAVGQLTGGIAHDFNNLLTGIIGALDLLQSRVGQGRYDSLERYVTVARGAAQRAATLTQRLLAFSRRQTLEPKVTEVNRLIAGIEELIRRSVGPHIQVEVIGAAGLWPTLIDPPQLENALINLCLNARDAMPSGGHITIETANRWLDDRAAAERGVPAGQYLSVCVTDTGTGMTPEVIAHAFDPFFTTKPIGEGTGLGLSMIYGFARQSGGQVRIYSEVGMGTTVCLYLPRHYAEIPEAEILTATAGVVSRDRQAVVLVIDDEASVRLLVSEVMADAGYSVIEAHDGPAGLKFLRSDMRIDLLITDVGLPGGLNGRQVADAAIALRSALKILFITGYAENATIGQGTLSSSMYLLTKPFSMQDLSRKVSEILR